MDIRIEDSLARGEICAGATLDGKLVAYTWRAFSATPHDPKYNIWADFNAAAVIGRYSFTLPAYRGKHIMPSLLAFADNCCLDKGATLLIAYIETDNYPSMRCAVKVGNHVVGYAGYIYLFGKLFRFRTPGAKEHGFLFFTLRSPAVDKLKARQSWWDFSLSE